VLCKRLPDSEAARRILADLIVSTERFDHSLAPYAPYEDLVEALQNCEYSAAGVIEAAYKVVARNAGKLVAGDRSPNDIGYLADFARSRLFRSGIRVVHLVRDPRDVYLSTHRLKWIPEDELHAEFPGIWASTNPMLRQMFRDAPEPYICVRYEDLITRPEQTAPVQDARPENAGWALPRRAAPRQGIAGVSDLADGRIPLGAAAPHRR
jgi:hypothetical protein